MKKRGLLFFFACSLILEVILSICFFNNSEVKNDTVKFNELIQEVEKNYGDSTKYPDYYEYAIIDNNENLFYRTSGDVNYVLNDAYKNGDTVVDLYVSNNLTGKIIIKSTINEQINHLKNAYIISISAVSLSQIIVLVLYLVFFNRRFIKPFDDMKSFAERVAGGNLDIPLTMDKGNNFGAFTESFDIMREELKKAKLKEAEAEKSKRELVARLSHDIKTPVASIKSVSELAMAISNDEKEIEKLNLINQKADQINTLVSNLFTITIEELDQLSINPVKIPSYVVSELINNSDYLNKANSFSTPECDVFFDRLRLQQVFDNIFANSYKYANTKIDVKVAINDVFLEISIKDYGDTIKDEEIPLLLEKYNRGSNIEGKDGSGLGLYISKKFIEAMNGKIELINNKPGFEVKVYLRII